MVSQIIPLLIGLFTALFTGYFLVSLIDRNLELRFRLLFAIPLGFGIHSIFYFLYQILNIYDFHKYQLFEYAVVIILAICYYTQEHPDFSKHKFRKLNNWFYVLNVYALSIFVQYFMNNPMGQWDGFRIWNTKAQFLMIQNPQWLNLFKLQDFMSHSDYPLFVPATTARIWMYQGAENYITNSLLGVLFTFTTAYLLYQTICYFKGEKVALITTSVLLISDVFLYNGAGQCADIPLALFILCAVASLFLYNKTKRTSTLALSFVFAGLCVWIKNEGLMFLAVYTTTLFGFFLYKKNWKSLIISVLLSLPFAAFALWFKSLCPVQNDLIHGIFANGTISFLTDANRYAVVLKSVIDVVLHQFTIFLALFILCIKGLKIRKSIKAPFLLALVILILMTIGYTLVYVASPHDINWIVDNSLVRILLQILPIFLLIFTLSLRIGKPDTLN